MLDAKSIICYEDYNFPNVGFIASEKNGQMVNDVYNLYKDRHFVNGDGTINSDFTRTYRL
ncbi:hypothetical protein SAMN05421544_10776 [Riemerella columbipharyngis]|uniref:Uncharacterized protein n=1 Tax=Riemerella columbipharyngis TaxID=1071918 RepID=A0A1G7C911_9FLAO|nr:hypothetical protein SAMN05421544_10776 [Riemerella columbipharyngis]